MSETAAPSPIDQYYTGEPADFPWLVQGEGRNLTVAFHGPEEGDVLDRAAAAQWRVLDVPQSSRQFEVLVFNPEARESTVLLPTTAGEYNGSGHMYEGALWSAQNPQQRLVLLPTFNLTKKELTYYARTGRLTVDDGNGQTYPLESMEQLASALRAAHIEANGIYGRSAGTKEASVLPQVLPSVTGIVLGAPPQLTKRSAVSFTQGALTENTGQRLTRSEHTAVDSFQVSDEWRRKVEIARYGQPERQRPTGAIVTFVGNAAVRAAHALGLSKGSEAFLADLPRKASGVRKDVVVYTEDALYNQGIHVALGAVAQHGVGVVAVAGGHRIPERYPRVTNDMADALLQQR